MADLPESFAQLKYVVFSWPNTPLLKRDGLARAWFKAHATLATLAASLGGFPLTLYEAPAAPSAVPELWLGGDQCARLIALLAQDMGPSRARDSWKHAAYHPRATLERAAAAAGGGRIVRHVFRDQRELERRFGELKDLDDWHATKTHWRELRRVQDVWRYLERQVHHDGGDLHRVDVVAVDVETWERDHDLVTEVGVATYCFERRGAPPRLECRHYILEENASKRNGRYCPDARDHFQFGTSRVLARADLEQRLALDLFGAPSAASARPKGGPTFLLLHDPRSDLKSLVSLGVPMHRFEQNPLLPAPPAPSSSSPSPTSGESPYDANPAFLLDTQRLFSGFSRRKRQVRLELACDALAVRMPSGSGGGTELAFHNSGNDAWATLQVFLRLLDARIGRTADEVKPPGWTPGGRPVAAAQSG
ncbi:hypothetical protein Rhopal_004925-T1 [Rhodotorula paludigena]|uniref:Gfd2/YDR514C-like C-terminal domain-containing protein n=1 Tax=Rhodotorula paludigena TaxID=86838 RepID=A0AAV5GPT7_9BASI|nr:hypothetical protein Rhopal_004925-T1 [Rhodotorula paludigena]